MSLAAEVVEGAARARVQVLAARCTGCRECVLRCPTGALGIDPAGSPATADSSRCVGCRQCVRACPDDAIVVTGPLVVPGPAPEAPRRPGSLLDGLDEVHVGFESLEAAVAETERCLACPEPPCVGGCPAHNDIPGLLAAVHEGDLAMAHALLRPTTLLADVCSRVCDRARWCEGACSLALAGGAPVAIVGAERAWRQVVEAGIELCCEHEVDPGELEALLREHDAVVLAHGAKEAARPRRSGAAAPARRVLVAFAGRDRATELAAEALRATFAEDGRRARTARLEEVGPGDVADLDLLVLGTGVGLGLQARSRPAATVRSFLAALPDLGGLAVAVFCTYALTSGSVLDQLASTVAAKGGRVVAAAAFGRRVVASPRGWLAPSRFADALMYPFETEVR